MSEPLVTRCPNCSTSFNVSQEQLEVANGKVRCGNCMYVFSAREFMVTPDDDVPTLSPAAAPAPAKETSKPQSKGIVTQAMPSPDPSTEAVFDEDDESFSQEVEVDISEEEAPAPSGRKEPDFNPEDFANIEHEEVSYDAVSAFTQEHSKQIADEHTRSAILKSLNEEPPEYRQARIAARIRYLVVWSILIILALAGLGAQFVWFNKDMLAQEPQLRPYLEQMCLHAQCELPPAMDLANIKNDHHVLRDHPESANKVLVNAIISNHASFEQPFPTIQIIFKDTNSRRIANYYISPAQYLKGEMKGKFTMPKKSPVHIAFDLPNPGDIATGHEIYFRPYDFKP